MAKLILHNNWRGLGSGGEVIPKGTYDDHADPALFGQAEYLVSAGQAEWIGAPPEDEVEDEVEYPDFNSKEFTLPKIDEWMAENNVTAPDGWDDMLKAVRIIWLEDELEGVHEADGE